MYLHFRGDSVDSLVLTMTNKVQWMLTTALLLSAASLGTSLSVDLSTVHEHMTDDEFFSVFHSKDRSAVPDYEVVSVFHEEVHRSRRSLTPTEEKGHYYVTLNDVNLYLEPVDHILIGEDTPVYTASGNKSHLHGIRYKRIEKAWPSHYNMYQDPVNNAAVLATKDGDGKVYFEGTIGNDLVIKPMPSRFRSVTDGRSNERDSSDHFVYKKDPFQFNIDENIDLTKYYGYASPAVPQGPKTETKVDIVYPEVLVIVDHATYLSHGKKLQALCRYLAVFWNAVDLRFRAMKEPKVRLNIAGLIVPIDEDGASYLTQHRYGQHFLRTSETFDSVGNYLYKEERLGKDMYDLVVVMTNFNLCSTTLKGCDASTLGQARIGGACKHDEDGADVAVAIIEDHNGFDGVLTAAHEIAHLLGVVHDGENSYFGPGAAACDGSQGYIMSSSQQSSSNAFLWSDCSINQMRYFLRREGECLRNKPMVKKPIAKMLPGMVMSRDEQCRITHGRQMLACNEYVDDECGRLYCRKPSGMFKKNKCISSRPPAEGSPCSDGGICLAGMCVREEEDNNEVSEWNGATTRRRDLISEVDE